jgi:biotin operon repressor
MTGRFAAPEVLEAMPDRPVSRPELVAMIKLPPTTIWDALVFLKENGAVIDAGVSPSKRGDHRGRSRTLFQKVK